MKNFLPFFTKAAIFRRVMNEKSLALLFAFGFSVSVFADAPAPVVAPVPSAAAVTPVIVAPPNPPAAVVIPVVVAPPAPAAPAAPEPPALIFDAESKEYNAKPGEATALFTFSLTNVSANEVVITNVATSCGCTVAQLPSQPWHLAPGANGEIKATMNLAGKQGRVTKQLTVNSSVGVKALLVHSIIPAAPAPAPAENLRGDREKNMEAAKADRQAVFKGDCASCHVAKGVGKMGHDLFVTDCNICHENTPSRAAMVPDLAQPKTPRDQNYWRSWITHGRVGSMMPAFADTEGGPLSKEQIESLVTYLYDAFPKEPVAAAAQAPNPLPVPIRILKP